MTNFAKTCGLVGMLAVALAIATPTAHAAQAHSAVSERRVVVTELGDNASAITYWMSEADGWHVVTTVDIVIGLDNDAEKHAVVRFSSILLPGQWQLISVPYAMGEQQQVLLISRLADRIAVALVFGSSV